jgi:cytochrome oxidase Cu insertion factor (SCO1/SenC/PrrC family)
MKLGPRAKLLLLMSLFALPIVASVLAYRYLQFSPTANYGELLLPPKLVTAQPFERMEGGRFAFPDLRGKWALVTSDSGACAARCVEKLTALRQVRLALGRNAGRVERVLVVDDTRAPDRTALAPFDGMVVAVTPTGMTLPPGAGNDRAHVYLVDPHGNVMMRWPSNPDLRRMYKDLDRLLKASQIG